MLAAVAIAADRDVVDFKLTQKRMEANYGHEHRRPVV